jgi:hypothetical protein
MILLVIFDHTIPWVYWDRNYNFIIGAYLWEYIALPVFLIIMGFNVSQSYERNGIFDRNYYLRKISRYLIPYTLIWVLSTLIGIFFYNTDNLQFIFENQIPPAYLDFRHVLIGVYPFWGPGSWFLPLLIISIFVLPLIHKGFAGKTIWAFLSLIFCVLIEFGLQMFIYTQLRPFSFDPVMIAEYNNYFNSWTFVLNPVFHISSFGLGMWIAKNHKLFSFHNIFIWIIGILSMIYIIVYQFFDFDFKDASGTKYFFNEGYSFLFVPYSAFIVLITLKLLPKNNRGVIKKIISVIGRSTYHILLTQILYMAILVAIYGNHYSTSFMGTVIDPSSPPNMESFYALFINWAVCIPIGIVWWGIETRIRKIQRKKD